MRVMLVSLFEPTDTGHGGNHRTYQLKHDVEKLIGVDSVSVVNFTEWRRAHRNKERRVGTVGRLRRNGLDYVRRRMENPISVFGDPGSSFLRFTQPEFLRHYEAVLSEGEKPAVCVIEHAGFAGVIELNRRHGIHTFGCPQNIESLDTCSNVDGRWMLRAAMYDFANEIATLSACAQRFLISRIEAGFYGGLGYTSQYYPYRPVGAIAQRHEDLRKRRLARKGKTGLLLLLGSAGHKTTQDGMTWFLDQCKRHGVPGDMRVIACGMKTDQLLRAGEPVPGVELKGWTEQATLDEWLVQADAVLCPQRRGFGALTKLPELACAGIPVIVPRCVSYALDLPPDVHLVEDSWDSWVQAMQAAGGASVAAQDYGRWCERQQSTLAQAIATVASSYAS